MTWTEKDAKDHEECQECHVSESLVYPVCQEQRENILRRRSVSGCCGGCTRQSWSTHFIFILSGAYNLVQLLYFLWEKLSILEGGDLEAAVNSVVQNETYPSIIHPPHLDPDVVTFYQNVTILINVSVILASVIAFVALFKNNSSLLIPWMVTFLTSLISETTIFFYLISNGKVSFTPVPAFILSIDFVLLLVQILFLVRVYSSYLKLKQGLRGNRTQLKTISPGLLVEESSEIASARASSIYRKSFHKKGPKKTLVNKYKKQTSLSKISEEDSENIASKSDNQATRNVEDKEMFSDKAITNSTSGNSNSNTDNENDMKEDEEDLEMETKSQVVSRFVPEIMNRYKITIV